MNRLFSPLPPGLYYVTATLDGTIQAYSTSVTVTFVDAPGGPPPGSMWATFPDFTVGTINAPVSYVSFFVLCVLMA